MLSDEALEGLTVHFTDPAGFNVLLGGGPEWLPAVQTFLRGETLLLTAEVIDASRDRYGESFFALADETEMQLLRWGKVRIGIGPSPVPVAVAEPPSEKYKVGNTTDGVFGAQRPDKYVVEVSYNSVTGSYSPSKSA